MSSETPIHNFLRGSWGENAATRIQKLNMLLEKGADVNERDENGNTALMHFASIKTPNEQDTVDILDFLLAAGADINAVNKNNETALWKASYLGRAPNVAYLLQSGADATITPISGHSPFHIALMFFSRPTIMAYAKAGYPIQPYELDYIRRKLNDIGFKRTPIEDAKFLDDIQKEISFRKRSSMTGLRAHLLELEGGRRRTRNRGRGKTRHIRKRKVGTSLRHKRT